MRRACFQFVCSWGPSAASGRDARVLELEGEGAHWLAVERPRGPLGEGDQAPRGLCLPRLPLPLAGCPCALGTVPALSHLKSFRGGPGGRDGRPVFLPSPAPSSPQPGPPGRVGAAAGIGPDTRPRFGGLAGGRIPGALGVRTECAPAPPLAGQDYRSVPATHPRLFREAGVAGWLATKSKTAQVE